MLIPRTKRTIRTVSIVVPTALLFWLFILQTSCAPPLCNNTCQPGKKKCNGQELLICAKETQSNCYIWGSIPCKNGCTETQGRATCTDNSCPKTDCKVGSKRCVSGDEGAVEICSQPPGKCLKWRSSIRCTDGTTCDAGECVPTSNCTDRCQEQQSKCIENSISHCVQDDKGCWDWGPHQACASNQVCTAGACKQSTQCNSCTEGQKQCRGNAIQTCVKDAKGCTQWGNEAMCPTGKACSKGTCIESCKDVCTQGTKQCKGNAVQTCIRAATGCTTWGSEKACGTQKQCTQGLCKRICQDVCTVGTKRCQDDSVQSCVKGAKGCTLWGAKTACPSGKTCSKQGICSSTCTNACVAGTKRCQGNTVQTCAKASNGCTQWGQDTACPSGKACSKGACIQTCSDACKVGESRCQSNAIQTCARASTGCLAWGRGRPCPPAHTCNQNKCVPTCSNACTAGTKRCQGNAVQTCTKAANGCTAWNTTSTCKSTEICSQNQCKPKCPQACTSGAKQCAGNTVQTCSRNAQGCLVWSNGTTCSASKICSQGTCVSPTDPSARSQQTVCSRWKRDFPTTTPANFKNKGGCDPGSISQGSIDDAIRRITLYRWMLGLPPTVEDKALSKQTQSCAILQAHNNGPTGGVNAHRPPSNWKCYQQTGASASGASNLSWGVGHPAETISQYISDERVPSLGHRLWIISAGFGKTGIGMATGPGRYRVASCLYTFARTAGPKKDYIAFPSPGWVPIQMMAGGRHTVRDWSFTSSKYNLSQIKEIKLTRTSDNNIQRLTSFRKIRGYGHPSGVSFRPRYPKAGETYKVELGTVFSYTVKFFDCK